MNILLVLVVINIYVITDFDRRPHVNHKFNQTQKWFSKSKLFLIKFEDDSLETVNVKVKALSHKKKRYNNALETTKVLVWEELSR